MSDLRVKEKQQTKLSRVRRGSWHNVWFIPPPYTSYDALTGELRGPGLAVSSQKFPSRELAEQYAINHQRFNFAAPADTRPIYLGPEFFPEPGDSQ